MMRCFSVCWWSHLGHLYWTSSYSKPYSLASSGRISWSDIARINVNVKQFLLWNDGFQMFIKIPQKLKTLDTIHYFWTLYISHWHHTTILTLKFGDRKFLRNQNLTGAFVWRRTDTIMILKKRSYKCPDATEKMFTFSASSSLPPPELKVLKLLNNQSDIQCKIHIFVCKIHWNKILITDQQIYEYVSLTLSK